MRINLANQITLSRLVLAGIFFALLSAFDAGRPAPRLFLLDIALGLYILAGITDVIDGYIARRRDEVTSFGRVIDPFVDKVLVCGAFIYFCSTHFVGPDGTNISGVQTWMVVVILARELLVTGLRGFSEAHGQRFAATIYGKVKMLVQSIAACWILGTIGFGEAIVSAETLYLTRQVAAWATVTVTLASLVGYIRRADVLFAERSD